MNREDRVDPSLPSKVKAGDIVYFPNVNAWSTGVEIAESVVEKVTQKTVWLASKRRGADYLGPRVQRQAEGFGGWRATWDEAFKVGQQMLEHEIASLERKIQNAGERLKLWERMPKPEEVAK